MKLWQKKTKLNRAIETFTVGDDFVLDQRLVKYDCIASRAHAKMLGKAGVLNKDEVGQLCAALDEIIELDAAGKFRILPEQEDCHTALENYLTEKLGEVGQKIHTARSRNDQVLAALRLFYKDELVACRTEIGELESSLTKFAEKFGAVQWPGFTHTRKAMPTTMSDWSGAIRDAMRDNLLLLEAGINLIDQSPLGTGAGFGIPMQIDRAFTAKELAFSRVQDNPIYVQNSRGKFETTILHVLAQIMFDLNKAATDLIFFSMPEFGFFELPEEFCTGSSIMPQKKNPDVLELMRAKYHVVSAHEMQLRSLISNLISGYHRDFQLTKGPIFESFEITLACLQIATMVFLNLGVDRDRCEEALTTEVFATEEVYKLVQSGLSFREAYRQVGKKY